MMKQLRYKTRGNSLPTGKPYVYFCAHEKDFSVFFDRITEKILKVANCAVFYDDGMGEVCDEETRFSDLLRMKLFILPITTRFLCDETSQAMVEFRFAVEHHIPVLPILQERGLEFRFNEICGEMQMISEVSSDDTEIGFNEKLKKFLSAILIGDELTEKVRAAFDAYIFLSYRKKDRKYAQELMRLIHKNEFCRDIAIWYDEFLTPGENFNDEIAAALDKSKIFALAVTPNLINEKNYVMDIEYPMAKNAEKPILPAEVVPTDQSMLKRYYESIPDVVDAHNSIALSEALMKVLETIAIRENDASPEHNFFIGLAYLSGIDVEIDRERALALITSSAEAGLPEAIEKLASMYEHGESVEYSSKEELKWRLKLIDVLQNTYEKSNDINDGIRLLNAMWAVRQNINYPDDDKVKVCERALEIAKQLWNTFNTPQVERLIGISYDNLAETLAYVGRLDEAEVRFREELDFDKQLVDKYGTHLYLRDLTCTCASIGKFYRLSKRDYKTAVYYYEQDVEIAEQLVCNDASEQSLRDLAHTYKALAELCDKLSRLDDAELYYQKLIAVRERLVKESGREDASSQLASAHLEFARFYEEHERLLEAENEYLLNLQLNRETANTTKAAEDEASLDLAISQLIDFYIKINKPSSAISYGEELIRVAERYAYSEFSYFNQIPGHAISSAYKKNAEIFEALGEWEKELHFLRKKVENGENIAEKYHLSYFSMVSMDYMDLGTRYYQNELYEESEQCSRKQLYCSVMVARKISLFDGLQTLRYACDELAYILDKRGKIDEAKQYRSWGETVSGVLADSTKEMVKWGEFAILCLEYADGCDADERNEWRWRVLEFYELMLKVAPDMTQYQDCIDKLRTELE